MVLTDCTNWRFNTQPPEGGWESGGTGQRFLQGFNTQPPEGGWIWALMAMMPSEAFQHTAA